MCEIPIIVAKEAYLDVCMGIKECCANLYHYYSNIYREIPGAALLWKQAAVKEEEHRKQFELALGRVNETEFEMSKEGLKQAFSIRSKLTKQLEHCRDNKPELLASIARAVDMEEKLADLHAHNSLHINDVFMQKMFGDLSEADRDHGADMQLYHSILYNREEKLADLRAHNALHLRDGFILKMFSNLCAADLDHGAVN